MLWLVPADDDATGADVMLLCSMALRFNEPILVDCGEAVDRLVCGSLSLAKSLFGRVDWFEARDLLTISNACAEYIKMPQRAHIQCTSIEIDCNYTYSVKNCLQCTFSGTYACSKMDWMEINTKLSFCSI